MYGGHGHSNYSLYLNDHPTVSRAFHLDEDALKFIVTSSRNFKETNPDVIDFTQVTGCELDVSEREREEKRKDADGKY